MVINNNNNNNNNSNNTAKFQTGNTMTAHTEDKQGPSSALP
jgi:hypothetical protein